MKILLTITLSIFSILISAQTVFIEDTQTFTGVYEGEAGFADFDGDGDQDIFQLGYSANFATHAILHKNDGDGQFTETTTSMPGLGYSSMAFADADGDNDMDILIAGQGGPNGAETSLFLNDGNGNFSNSNQNFTAVIHCSIGFADVDNDTDQDILILGTSATWSEIITEMYINDGMGNYSLSATNFTKAYQGAFDFADVDGDDDLDVLITGSINNGFDQSAILYKNDGSGNFSEVSGTSFSKMSSSSVTFEDIDGDGDEDVILTGFFNNGLTTKLYKNDGNGNFTEVVNSGIINVAFGSCSFADVDLDGDPDLLIAGRKGAIPDETAKLYFNDGNGNFTEDLISSFTGATASTVDFADVDGDGDSDAFIIGIAPDNAIYSKLYINDLMVGTESPLFSFESKVYPNPFDESIFLEFEKNVTELTIEISNSVGQILKTNRYENISKIEVSTLSFSSGIYFLKLIDSNTQSEVITIVKK